MGLRIPVRPFGLIHRAFLRLRQNRSEPPYTMDQKEEGGPFLFSLTVQDADFGDDLRDFPPLPVFSFTE